MGGRIIISAILVCVLVGAFAWFAYYPSSPMITTLGLPGPKADLERECGARYRKIGPVRWVPTRELVCRGPWEIGGYLREEQDVTLDGLTRRIGHARRFWSLPDSVSWQRARDSVVSTMPRLGGGRISCWKSPYNDSITHIRDTEYWKFPSYSVRLIAYRAEDGHNRSPWLLQLDGYRSLPSECVFDPWRYNR
jgi:hypothetical protein